MLHPLQEEKRAQRKKILQPAEGDNAQHCEETYEDKGDGEQHAEGTIQHSENQMSNVFFGDNGDIVKYYTGLPNLGNVLVYI